MKRPLHPPPVHRLGFTLVEVLCVVTIAAVLMAIAAPSFLQQQRNSRLSSATTELQHGLLLARNEALRSGYNTFVQPINGSNWQAGWHSYIDFDRNNAYTAGTDQLLQTAAPAPNYITITGQRSAGTGAYISFSGNGFARAVQQQGAPNLTLLLERIDDAAADNPQARRQIIVARSGRIRSCNPNTDSTCTRNAVN